MIPRRQLLGAILNSIAVAVPATVIPILIAALRPMALRDGLHRQAFFFIIVVALLVVPLQIALVPILRDYARINLNGTFRRSGWRIPVLACRWPSFALQLHSHHAARF